MTPIAATEQSPLLPLHQKTCCDNKEPSYPEPICFPVHILGELIGIRHLTALNKTNRRAKRLTEPYCVVQYGSKTMHRTNALSKDCIWTIKERPLFLVPITENDVRNNKALTLAMWKKRSSSKKSRGGETSIFLGKIQIKSAGIFDLCNEERVEMELVDDLGRIVQSTSTISEGSFEPVEEHNAPTLALRFRFASRADIQFVQSWNEATSSAATVTIARTVLNGTGVIPEENRERAVLVTELEEWDVQGASFGSAVTSTLRRSPRRRQHVFRIKPCPDSNESAMTEQLVSRDELKSITQQPSRQWVEAGSGTLGRLHLEILSCSQLPNVDYGNAVGNETDAFVTAMYGDAMVQTEIIDDELSPHWPPWSQRAFCFSIMHPSQVLYLGVFGYKRGLFNHAPIGRVEVNLVNFQHDSEYNLEYDLFAECHVTNRKSAGKIRIRLRMEVFDERVALLAALRPCPPIYVSVRKKKSLHVARFTASGEYDNPESFSLKVLLAYIDEITKVFLQRFLYAFGDGVQSLVFWRGQVQVGPVWFPIYSFVVFCAIVMVIERPQFIPAFLFLGAGFLMLVNMTVRIQSPSPWHRCQSFWHYFCVLLFGISLSKVSKVEAEEGWKEQRDIQQEWKKRAEDNERFFHKKEAVEKEIEASKISVQTESKAAIVSLELLIILGKIQGIVGTFVRLGRAVDCVVTWEESSLAFWLTTTLLMIGFVFLFVPWVFVITWSSRIAVILFLGPQNKLIDIFLARKESDESKLRQMYEERRFRARCRQEEDSKLKSFRHIIFGRFGSVVPDIKWSPHLDRPCPESELTLSKTPVPRSDQLEATHKRPCIPGQKLYGLMVPRPYNEWVVNLNESKAIKEQMLDTLSKLNMNPPERHTTFLVVPSLDEDDYMEEEGVEVSDVLDIEADLAFPTERVVRREESLKGDWGVEAVDINAAESMFLQKTFERSFSNFSEKPDSDMLNIDGSNEPMDNQLPTVFSDQIHLTGSERLQLMQAQLGKSQRELGVEVQSEFMEEYPEEKIGQGSDDHPLPAVLKGLVRDSGPELYLKMPTSSQKLQYGNDHDRNSSSDTSCDDAGSIDDLDAVSSDSISISNVHTMEAEAGASQRELGVEIVPFGDKW